MDDNETPAGSSDRAAILNVTFIQHEVLTEAPGAAGLSSYPWPADFVSRWRATPGESWLQFRTRILLDLRERGTLEALVHVERPKDFWIKNLEVWESIPVVWQ
jgi:hypothetical protein